MKLLVYTLRKPWVKYENVELDIDEEFMGALLRSIASEYVADIISNDLCDVECEVIDYLEKTVKP